MRPFEQKLAFRATYRTPDYEIEFIPDTQMRNQNGGGQDINFPLGPSASWALEWQHPQLNLCGKCRVDLWRVWRRGYGTQLLEL